MTTIDDYKKANERSASVMQIGGFRPSGNPQTSHFGLPPLAHPDEKWPHYDGKPLFFLCQLNLTEAPAVPTAMQDIKLITLFITMDEIPKKVAGNNWVIREYAALENLVQLEIPKGSSTYRGFEVKYERTLDYPDYVDPDLVVPGGFTRASVHLDNIAKTKIGGFASNIQSEQWWGYGNDDQDKELIDKYKPQFCFQIASEDKLRLYWGDAGILYFARSSSNAEPRWFFDSQCG